ncbi:MAG: uridine diphosphate-N-acetylglucosamine-binding protein YvcK [Candidatus Harrisonbacteria bacterium]|nr:uridine diphosphate-N-acetylglucosamine-binding protein YvcK [Candidatus Harrisonbacteria bacterium]
MKNQAKTNKKIVVIGGGTGVYTVLTALKPYFQNLTAIVTMADDGGSTGILREEFGILPPGDIRRALIALSASNNRMLADLFSYRFEEGVGLTGHNFGNLLITALHRITNDFEAAINEAGKILMVEGKVVPVTLRQAQLMAELEDGQIITGETNIDIPQHDGRLKIKRVWLKPQVNINPNAEKEILDADLIIIGPGDLYTSLIPNLLVKGLKEALQRTGGKVIYFVNLMTKFGETGNFAASDFINTINLYLGDGVLDFAVINNKRPAPQRLVAYVKERSEFVEPDLGNIRPSKDFMPLAADVLRARGLVRHDLEKVAKVVKMLV